MMRVEGVKDAALLLANMQDPHALTLEEVTDKLGLQSRRGFRLQGRAVGCHDAKGFPED